MVRWSITLRSTDLFPPLFFSSLQPQSRHYLVRTVFLCKLCSQSFVDLPFQAPPLSTTGERVTL